jgi:copper chaperone
MQTRTFHVSNISCGHCAMTIKRELETLPGIVSIQVDVAAKTVTIAWSGAMLQWEEIRRVLVEIGFPPDESV